MHLLSCTNCWFNGLQYDSLGLSVGYCTEHEIVLRSSDEITCGRQIRKDMPLASARWLNEQHQSTFDRDVVTDLYLGEPARDGSSFDRSGAGRTLLASNDVGAVVTDYSEGPKIAALARLDQIGGTLGELAFLSLSRSYVRRCALRNGPWTSGIHLLQWTRRRWTEVPEVKASELRLSLPLPMKRQVEMVQWSLLMLRLTFVADVGSWADAQGDEVGALSSLPDDAAEAASTSLPKLKRFLRGAGAAALDKYFPQARYQALKSELRKPSKDGGAFI